MITKLLNNLKEILSGCEYQFQYKRIMDTNIEIQQLKDNGFVGFKTVRELMHSPYVIPASGGVYVCLRIKDTDPVFLEKGTGGFFKRSNPKDPNVPVDKLKENWVEETSIVYIGKASSLCKRLCSYLHFGMGLFATHWGGRYIWQLKDSKDLIVCWKTTKENPRDVEKRMIGNFKKAHNGKRPFANLQD